MGTQTGNKREKKGRLSSKSLLWNPTNAYVSKKIRDISDDYNLNKDYHISIVFGTNIRDIAGHQTTVQVPTSPKSASALPVLIHSAHCTTASNPVYSKSRKAADLKLST